MGLASELGDDGTGETELDDDGTGNQERKECGVVSSVAPNWLIWCTVWGPRPSLFVHLVMTYKHDKMNDELKQTVDEQSDDPGIIVNPLPTDVQLEIISKTVGQKKVTYISGLGGSLSRPPRPRDDEEEVSNEVDEEEVFEESEEDEPKKSDPKPDSSSEEDGSDSRSDEEVTHVAPMKPIEVQSPKRPGESKADGKDSKKMKKVEDKRVAEVEVKKVGEDPKKQLFQRLFSEEDEIEMFKALLDYIGQEIN
ncbi:hypothetical protein QQ045_022200 [Rhodiola kirilowii]